MTVGDILAVIERWAPAPVAQSYDNVGLLVGEGNADVEKVLTAMDLVPSVIDEAIDTGCHLIVTHHPIMFSSIKRVTSDSLEGSMISRLIKSDIALIAAHTNLDAAVGGVSFALAEKLGLNDIEFLEPHSGTIMKLVTFVPQEAIDDVRTALAEAGAGVIGNYDRCGFGAEGTGNFRPLPGANPHAGEVDGKVHFEKEIRYEVELPAWKVSSVLTALKESHPYEEVAYDLYAVHQPSTRFGMGAIGTLEVPQSLTRFLQWVSAGLETPALRYVGNLDQIVSKVAVCGGSGSSLITQAIHSGADVFVTGDITYHRFFEVLDTDGLPQMALVDAGHYETEYMTEDLLRDFIATSCPGVSVRSTSRRTSPVSTFSI